jgi:hypothetical protein
MKDAEKCMVGNVDSYLFPRNHVNYIDASFFLKVEDSEAKKNLCTQQDFPYMNPWFSVVSGTCIGY